MKLRFMFGFVVVAALLLPGGAAAIAPKVQFSYTGGEQSYVVPPGVFLLGIAAEGGHGGGGNGGREGGVGALLAVTPGEKLFVEVGAAGSYDGGATFGGGGAAGAPPPVLCMSGGSPCSGAYASSGGGASDVRTCSISASSCPGGVSSAATRLLVGGGGGGNAGGGNAPGDACSADAGGASANNFQYPPGNPAGGPVPIITAAGIVYPGRPTHESPIYSPGVTPAGGGGNSDGTGGLEGGCNAGGGSATFSDSVAGSNAVGPVGGTGGNASSLGPMDPKCNLSSGNCYDAGAGGGGGGGYFGGGGGGTGLDRETGSACPCDNATSGQGGGGGSSFVSNRMMDPVDQSNLLGAGNGIVVIVPAIEIDAPANGGVYTPGQVVDASWSCGYDSMTGLGMAAGPHCTGSVATGSPIDTSPGTHTFRVSGTAYSNGYNPVSATVTYTVKSGGGGKHVSASAGGFTFTLTGPGSSVKKGGKLTVTLTKGGKGTNVKIGKYKYYLKGTHKPPILVTSRAGTFGLSLRGLGSGSHTLTVVITLPSTKHHAKSKTVTLKLPFTIG